MVVLLLVSVGMYLSVQVCVFVFALLPVWMLYTGAYMNMCLCVGTLEFKVLVNELVNVSECVFMSVGDFVNVSECKECVNVCVQSTFV